MSELWCIPVMNLWLSQNALLGQATPAPGAPVQLVPSNFFDQLVTSVPRVLGAIALLILGWLVALIVASVVKGLLNRTSIDNRMVSWISSGQPGTAPPPIEKWISTAVFWIIMAFAVVGFLNVLQLEGVSAPLNSFLQQIFAYLPRIGGAAVLLLVAWLVATLAKAVLTRGLARFNLDDRLAAQSDGQPSPFMLNETLGNALYWFVLLFFLPLILDVLQLQGPLAPVQNLLNQILSALPKILTAVIIGAVGWLIARIVRGIVTNLLAAVGTDQIGTRVGLTKSTGGLSLSSLIGTIVYVLVLIPTAIAALNALDVAAISAPATRMLEQILTTLPQIFTAALILVLFYVIGRFVADLVASILSSIGFDNVFNWLGLPTVSASSSAPPFPEDILADEPITTRQTAALPSRTPSEIAGIVVLVGIVLFGAVAATEVIGLPVLTTIVNGILAVSARVLIGVVIFGIGLYLANLAFQIISASGNGQARVLGQTARIAIIALVTAMALQQMGIASSIVNLAFGLLLGAIAVAIALAFGLGGRDVAGEQVRNWLNSFRGR
jgi:hypothetical protein